MRQPSEQRRLLAVVIADIVSYSRLMAEDEADTFYRLKDLQSSLITPTTERNHGRIVKWTGDGFIATFDSAVDAVRAAVEIQSGVTAVGAGAAEDRRIRLRIGINAGDVIVVPDDVYGDTVNVAARLETLATPGGICISRGVRDTVRGKFSVDFEDRGELAVKNIPDPVGTFSVIFDPIAWTMGRAAAPARSRRPVYLAAAAAVLLAGVGAIAAGWYWWRQPPSETANVAAPPSRSAPTGSPFQEQLIARLGEAAPGLSPKVRAGVAAAYEAESPHRAIVVSTEPAGLWRSGGRPTTENAEQSALENCQTFFVKPCVLIATDSAVQPVPAGNDWSHHDMPRVNYAGAFDPEQIPGVFPAARERADVVKYRSVAGPKAAAFTPSGGRIFLSTTATSQRAAEEEALRSCTAEPLRVRDNGACYLYAVGDRVVLSLRLTAPLTPAGPTAAPPPPPASSAAPPPPPTAPAAARSNAETPQSPPLRVALVARLASVAPGLPLQRREELARQYEESAGAKAEAAAPELSALWRSADRPSAENAEISVLENCQIAYGRPCILLAVNDRVSPVPADNQWPRRDMPRANYAGLFEPEQIPGAVPAARRRPDILGYRHAASPKAAAFHPSGGRIFVVTNAASQRAAEEQALKTCSADRPDYVVAGTCFLYAVGDQVVLPRRLREPLTAAAGR